MRAVGRGFAVILSVAFVARCAAGGAAEPPKQPASGPGGADYCHASVTKSLQGEGDLEYWVFEPAGPAPASAPVIVFNHGWGGTNPRAYGAWIEHLVRKGNIVIFPRYQAGLRTPTERFTPNAIEAVKDAIRLLQQEGHVRPELDHFAIVGHSAGGQVSANMAALASSAGLPAPKAVMCVQPGKSWNLNQKIAIRLEDLSKVPRETLLLAVVGDKDTLARDVDAKRIFKETTQVPAANKNYVILVSDDHGKPELVANHFAPVAANAAYGPKEKEEGGDLRGRIRQRLGLKAGGSNEEEQGIPEKEIGPASVNALDYYGLWKLFDGLCDAAFYGKNREYALGNTPEQRFMGKWSDGTPVKEVVVSENP
jgi:dienelactone hydrolase